SYAVRRGDVLFNRTSETDAELGLAATYLGTERVVFGGFVIRGRPTDNRFDPRYSGYALRAPAIRSQIIRMGQGAIRANIGQQNLKLVIAPHSAQARTTRHRGGLERCGCAAERARPAHRQEVRPQAGCNAATPHRPDPPPRLPRSVARCHAWTNHNEVFDRSESEAK